MWVTQRDQWEADRNMSPEERDSGRATFTDHWISDRATFIDAAVVKNAKDESDTVLVNSVDVPRTTAMIDFATGRTILSGAINTNLRAQIVFGGIGDDPLDGFGKADHLYGGAGDDILNGQGGADWLEGNSGDDDLKGGDGADTLLGGTGDDNLEGGADNDLLLGGAGTDTYKFSAGWGSDIVQDSDGLGRLMVGTTQLTGGKLITPGVYRSADDKITYTFDSNSRSLTIDFVPTAGFAERGDRIVVRNWQSGQSGQLSLLFDEVPAVVNTTITLAGDPAPNTLVIPNKGYASATIIGLDGDDALQSIGVGASAPLSGGTPPALDWAADRDLLDGGNGADTIYGGDGRDTIVGGAGDDVVWGGIMMAFGGGNPFTPDVGFDEANPTAFVEWNFASGGARPIPTSSTLATATTLCKQAGAATWCTVDWGSIC